MKRVIALLLAPVLLASCGRSWSWADYMAIHKDGLGKLEAPQQMNARYREVDNFIVHFGSRKQPLEWQTVAFIDGRFDLTAVIPIEVDYSKRTVTQVGKPKFYLVAAKEVQGMQTTFDEKLDRKFGEAEWDKFVRSGFDLTTLGIPRDEIRPIPH
jgi:hypothetical protein